MLMLLIKQSILNLLQVHEDGLLIVNAPVNSFFIDPLLDFNVSNELIYLVRRFAII